MTEKINIEKSIKNFIYYFVVGVSLGIGVVGTFTGNPQGVTHMFLLLILLTLLAIGEKVK